MFPTREEALAEAKRRESMAKRHDWRPEEGQTFWFYDVADGTPTCSSSFRFGQDAALWYIGNVHETKEEAEEWGRKYAEYFK